jgi:hypothetical protein
MRLNRHDSSFVMLSQVITKHPGLVMVLVVQQHIYHL